MVIKQMRRLEAKLGERLERIEREDKEGLDLVKKNTQSVNAKVEALSKDIGNTQEGRGLVPLEFNGYVLVLWNQVLCDIRRIRRPIVENWAELKRDLRERFVPSYYAIDPYNQLQKLYQGSMSVQEYHKEMKYVSRELKIVVDMQVSLAFTTRSYEDQVVCDVVIMEATHILLDRS
ncbi:hypothetical protein CR513_01817, partial [Mucuna pruriens]